MTASTAIDPAWPLLLLPGTLCDARVFAPMLAALANHSAMTGRAIHHGALTSHDSTRALARALLEQAPPRFIAVGFSLGAIVALELATQAPDRLAAMVLIAGNARAVPAADLPMRRTMTSISPDDLVGNVLWSRSVAPSRQNDAALRDAIVAMARTAPPGTLPLQTEVALTRPDKRAHLAGMIMPALIICGTLDVIAPPALQQEMAQALPHATLSMIVDAGHFCLLEQPEACAHALGNWLAQPAPPLLHSSPMEVS